MGDASSVRWRVLGAWVAAAAAAYGGLAAFLPEAAPRRAAAPGRGQAVPAARPSGVGAGAEHAGPTEGAHGLEDACGLAPKALLERFRDAVSAERGAVHRVRDRAGALAAADQVVVGLRGGEAVDATAQGLAKRHGLAVARVLPRLGQAVLTGARAEERLDALRGDPAVRYAEPNYVARVALRPNDSFVPILPQRQAGLEAAWDVTTGDPNVVVALLDTGVDPQHPDLVQRLLPGFDFVNNTAVLRDDNGHGTAMAGIIAAEGQNQIGLAGVAMDCRILPVKVADAMGQATVADVAAGLDYAVAQGARVANLSLGTHVSSQALEDAVNRALAAGLVLVAAAGNDPVHHEMYPASYDGVLSVTTLSKGGELGYDAVVAAGVDVGAPGEDLVTTLPGDVYGFVSGSSAAAAFASGVAALCLSRSPTLTGAQVREALRQGARPIAALKDLSRQFAFGALDARLAVDRALPGYQDVAVTRLRVYPRKPQPGAAATVVAEVANQGTVDLANVVVRVAHLQNGARIEIGLRVVPALAVGERTEVVLPFVAPATGDYLLRAVASGVPGDAEPGDNARAIPLRVDPAAVADVGVVALSISEPNAAAGQVVATATIENFGTADAQNVVVDGGVGPAGSSLPVAPGAGAPASAPQQVVPVLPVGGSAQVRVAWVVPTPAPTAIQRFRISVQPLAGETATGDNTAYFDFRLGATANLRGLYQQSNGVDIIPDAPWRVDPARPYVPLSIFVPSKGGTSPSTRLRIERTAVSVADAPGAPRTPVFEDRPGQPPSVQSAGMQRVDELGALQASLDPFDDRPLDQNGRHLVLRIPRADLGVPPSPPAPVDKYLDARVEWSQERVLFFVFKKTRSGSHRAVLRTRFSSAPFPALPGDNHYHDVHHHTIAEWYFGSPLDIFAPRKAYGGPLLMVVESAYAMGVIDQPTFQAARERIITTDHNSFNNRTIPDPDSPDHRPPFGPQSVGQQPGTTQLEAYRAIFGDAAAEEVAFKQDVPLPSLPLVNNILNLLPGIPLGAHMLLYRAEHVEGPWHGGGWLVGPGNPNINVDLRGVLNDVAKNRQGNQGRSFAYAAHPFSGQGWNDANLEREFGLDPQHRTRDTLHDATREFVLKGVEYFNGRGTRKLPTAQIDFENLDPWSDPDFQRGEADWDKALWEGQTRWHQMLAKTLDYAFVSDPETRFVRKIYQAGGSDAHGDFNFSTGRAATPLNVQATYNVGDEAWYKVRTYCLGDGKPGATPEQRWLEAYADGNSVTTDGPLLAFRLDANGRFDGRDLRWHDRSSRYEDADGRIGGDGPLDGGFTALVERGSSAPVFRYRYTSSDEFGPVASLLLYKTEAGNPNPTRTRGGGGLLGQTYEQIVGVAEFPLGGADTDLERPLDPAREGPVTAITAWAMGAFTGGNPDVIDLGPDEYRCYTNPVFAVPYDVAVTVSSTAGGEIPTGALTVEFRFDISMEPGNYRVEVKALDANGDSTGRSDPPLLALAPAAGSGWSDRPGIKNSVLTLTNPAPISLNQPAYPGPGRTTFVVYFADPPRDAAGNALNPIATTFEGVVGSTGSTGGGSTAGGSTGSTGGGGTAAGGSSTAGGGSGGGSCSVSPRPGRGPSALGLLVLLALLCLARARSPSAPEGPMGEEGLEPPTPSV